MGLFIGGLPGERVPGGLEVVHVSIELLLFGADFLVVVFELLGGSKARKEGEIGSHDDLVFITYFNIIDNKTAIKFRQLLRFVSYKDLPSVMGKLALLFALLLFLGSTALTLKEYEELEIENP